MERSELTIVVSGDSARVSLRYAGQEYTERWNRIGKGDSLHMDSNGAQVDMPRELTQSVDPKFLAKMMDILSQY